MGKVYYAGFWRTVFVIEYSTHGGRTYAEVILTGFRFTKMVLASDIKRAA